jgi:hypothetical protein
MRTARLRGVAVLAPRARVVAAQTAVDDLLAIGLDEPVGSEPLERGVQRPGLQLDPPA